MKEEILEIGEKAALGKILDMVKKTLGPEKFIRDLPSCTHYSPVDIERFLNEEVPESTSRIFIEHCKDCSACAFQLKEAIQKKIQIQEKAENDYLLKATMERIDRIDRERERSISLSGRIQKDDILDINIKTDGVVFIPVTTSGEQLTPTSDGIRSKKGSGEVEFYNLGMSIKKDFAETGVSIQVDLISSGKNKARLDISIFKIKNEEFIHGVAVNLIRGTTIEQTTITDKRGKAFFIIETPGKDDVIPSINYKIDMYEVEEQLCKIILDIKN